MSDGTFEGVSYTSMCASEGTPTGEQASYMDQRGEELANICAGCGVPMGEGDGATFSDECQSCSKDSWQSLTPANIPWTQS